MPESTIERAAQGPVVGRARDRSRSGRLLRITAAVFAVALLVHGADRSAFSDPFTGSGVAPGVNAFSWFAALFEMAAGLAFGLAGLAAVRETR